MQDWNVLKELFQLEEATACLGKTNILVNLDPMETMFSFVYVQRLYQRCPWL